MFIVRSHLHFCAVGSLEVFLFFFCFCFFIRSYRIQIILKQNWLTDGLRTGPTYPYQREPGNNHNKKVFQSFFSPKLVPHHQMQFYVIPRRALNLGKQSAYSKPRRQIKMYLDYTYIKPMISVMFTLILDKRQAFSFHFSKDSFRKINYCTHVQLNLFFKNHPKSSTYRFRAWRHSHPPRHFLSGVFIMTSVIVRSFPRERGHLRSISVYLPTLAPPCKLVRDDLIGCVSHARLRFFAL